MVFVSTLVRGLIRLVRSDWACVLVGETTVGCH